MLAETFDLVSILSLLAAILASLLGVVLTISSLRGIKSLREEMSQDVRTPINVQSSHPPEPQIEKLAENRLTELEAEIRGLKKLLLDDPEASLTIPLLKKDVDHIKEQIKIVGDSAKWFIAMIVTLAIGLLGVAISILLK